VGVLHNTSEPAFQRWGEETEVVARSQGLAALRVGLASPSVAAMQHGLRQAHAQGVEAVIVVRDFLTAALHRHVSAICLERGLPIMAEERIYPEAGALMSYGASEREQFRGVATYVHRLLKGASPAGLPIEQVARFELVLNLKTARALGLKPAQSLLLAADEVIE